jgi:uncharacterized protein YheU (UPF0270 family)
MDNLKMEYDYLVQKYMGLSENHLNSLIERVKLPENTDYKPLIDALNKAIASKKLLQELDLVKLWSKEYDYFIKNQYDETKVKTIRIDYTFYF